MKFNEFHRIIIRNGWIKIRQKGSHVIYEKDGAIATVPNHGSKEIDEKLRFKLIKEMELQ